MKEKQVLMRASLLALYLDVDERIAKDVNNKVMDVVEDQQVLLHQIFKDITKDNRLSPDTFDKLVEAVK